MNNKTGSVVGNALQTMKRLACVRACGRAGVRARVRVYVLMYSTYDTCQVHSTVAHVQYKQYDLRSASRQSLRKSDSNDRVRSASIHLAPRCGATVWRSHESTIKLN